MKKSVPAPVPDVAPNAPIAQEEILAEASDEAPLERTNRVLLFVGSLLAISVICISIFVLVLALKEQSQTTKKSSPSVVTSITPVAATPTVKVFDRNNITFEVLNGSGVPGAAGTLAAKLTAAGYIIVSVGNAPKQTETTIELLTKDSVLFDELLTFVPGATDGGRLTDSTAAARIIVGKK